MGELNKQQFKTLGDALGMPTDYDKERIRRIILRYERKYPGRLEQTIRVSRADHEAQGGRVAEFSEVNKAAHGRVVLELPEELHSKIEHLIPTIFSEKKHFHWFIKNFPELVIPRKY